MNSYNQFKQNINNIFCYVVDSFDSVIDIQMLFEYSNLEEFKKDKLFKDTIEAFKLFTQELELNSIDLNASSLKNYLLLLPLLTLDKYKLSITNDNYIRIYTKDITGNVVYCTIKEDHFKFTVNTPSHSIESKVRLYENNFNKFEKLFEIYTLKEI